MGKVIGEKSTTNQGSKDKEIIEKGTQNSENEIHVELNKVASSADELDNRQVPLLDDSLEVSVLEKKESLDNKDQILTPVSSESLPNKNSNPQSVVESTVLANDLTDQETSFVSTDEKGVKSTKVFNKELDSEKSRLEDVEEQKVEKNKDENILSKPESSKQENEGDTTHDNVTNQDEDDSDNSPQYCDVSPLDTCQTSSPDLTTSHTSQPTTKEESASVDQAFTSKEEEKIKKSEKKEKQSFDKSKPINVKLDFDTDNFYSSFDKPGDCIKRLFTGIEHDPIFENVEDNNSSSLDLSSMSKDVFKDNDRKKEIVSACYIYNYKFENKPFQRLEIAVATKNEGWVWMMGSLPTAGNKESQTTFFREFILKNEGNGWESILGHEGKVEFKYALPPFNTNILRVANGFESNDNHKWVNLQDDSECFQNCEKPNSYRSFSAYWKPDPSSEKILGKLSNKTEEQILRWGNYKNELYGKHYDGFDKKNNRSRIYQNGKWHKNLDSYTQKELFKLEDKDLKNTRGKWENFYKLCQSNQKDKYFKIYCSNDSSELIEANHKEKEQLENTDNEHSDSLIVKEQQTQIETPFKGEGYKAQLEDNTWGIESLLDNSEQNIHEEDLIIDFDEIDESESLKEIQSSETLNTTKSVEEVSTDSETILDEDNDDDYYDCDEEDEECYCDDDGCYYDEDEYEDEEEDIDFENYPIKQPEEKKESPINFKIDLENDDFYKSFNNPSDCITRLFNEIKDDSIFKDNNTDTTNSPDVLAKEIFKHNYSNNKINNACFMYNFKMRNLSERLDIAVRAENEGWVWMIGSKQNEDRIKKIWYREFILENTNGTWKITYGHEGEIVPSDDIDTNRATRFEEWANLMWVDANLKKLSEKSVQEHIGNDQLSLNLYWKPNDYGDKKLSGIYSNIDNQIIRWNEKKDVIDKNRKRIYWKNKWYTNVESNKGKELINLKKHNVAEALGEWANLYFLCTKDKDKSELKSYYDTYCS